MTAAALLEIEKEFSALLTNKKNWRKLLPADSCRKEKSDLILRDSIQGGIYEAILWCNPGFGILSQKQCPKYCMHIRLFSFRLPYPEAADVSAAGTGNSAGNSGGTG